MSCLHFSKPLQQSGKNLNSRLLNVNVALPITGQSRDLGLVSFPVSKTGYWLILEPVEPVCVEPNTLGCPVLPAMAWHSTELQDLYAQWGSGTHFPKMGKWEEDTFPKTMDFSP